MPTGGLSRYATWHMPPGVYAMAATRTAPNRKRCAARVAISRGAVDLVRKRRWLRLDSRGDRRGGGYFAGSGGERLIVLLARRLAEPCRRTFQVMADSTMCGA